MRHDKALASFLALLYHGKSIQQSPSDLDILDEKRKVRLGIAAHWFAYLLPLVGWIMDGILSSLASVCAVPHRTVLPSTPLTFDSGRDTLTALTVGCGPSCLTDSQGFGSFPLI